MPARVERYLILGGTAEAVTLATTLMQTGEAEVITSLAGRTASPASLPGLVRIGGFGGVDGLVCYLRAEGITRVYDATHPFARTISTNAAAACRQTGIPLHVMRRPAWQPHPDDVWIKVETLEQAARALPSGARVFLALGSQYIRAFAHRKDCHFVVRMIDAPTSDLGFPNAHIILGKADADWEKEKQVLESHKITHVVARNSGGDASYGKISAARRLHIPVVMIARRDDEAPENQTARCGIS
ncbi:cobalt-precorrin-6A reductase [Rhizobium oryziradicis]|uniref:Cobalt-precorrin-6A reductase n=1 Tax=Rhizobium oryziradicis TaxID=1867956 RepID=A0A1Q8ZNQ5_9HYPH|nr:cobalt-precorrin-6A reductase [Rhizobium oryziradicis]OLP43512.1 cobalt-precorrin-6A reductase [Rhizobium oryziradicis]